MISDLIIPQICALSSVHCGSLDSGHCGFACLRSGGAHLGLHRSHPVPQVWTWQLCPRCSSPPPSSGYRIGYIGRLPGLDNARMCEVMGVAVQGILGFYGRTTPMTWADCEAIEAARAGALRARGFSPGNPRVQIYAATEQGGLGHPHAYRVAAGALIAQIDRVLSGDDGEPQREAARSAVTEKCKQLGCRGE